MVQYHKESKTVISGTGGRKRRNRDKVKAHYGGFFARPHVSKEESKYERKMCKGGSVKIASKKVAFVNVSTGGKTVKAKVLTVIESPDNRHYARENVLTKGALVDTELGKARITSRPGQHGVVSAILVQAAGKAEEKPAAKAEKPEAKPPAQK